MKLDITRTRKLLKAFDFATLFREELGWEPQRYDLTVMVEGQAFKLETIAHKRGFMALWLKGQIPAYAMRRKIDAQVEKSYHEHLVIYSDAGMTTQVWQWVKREAGRPAASRETTFRVEGNGDGLIQKLEQVAVTLDEEERLTILDVAERVKSGFDVEKVTKKFYERFKDEHAAFLKFVKGIPEEGMQRWYVSVTLNRLMFVYFIQKKGFLDGNADYLRAKLAESQGRGADRFYGEFLCPLFFRGFAARQHDAETVRLLGNVPYLNGGIFARHQIEQRYGEKINIPDAAFERLFAFFEQYQWHLDERPLRKDNEINPDVLGYIFEKYINQKQMGAYYTKEDITEYISKNTVIPFLFEKALTPGPSPKGGGEMWKLLAADPDRYIYPAIKVGVELPLPAEIAAGEADPARREGWNKPALAEFALPTEIWRETVARRLRYAEIRQKLAAGEVNDINALITLNLDARQFAQDALENAESVEFVRAFWKALTGLSLLDPTVGSGAFLFAALNVLEPLYEACLERIQVFVDELDASGEPHRPAQGRNLSDFRKALAEMARHPNRRYFILKSIMVNNLYGVDIMEEAVEICKLRLFLKLVAQVERVEQVEPLPDIDFNIRAGNTLVGFATREDVRRAVNTGTLGGVQTEKLFAMPEEESQLKRIEEKAGDVERLFRLFRQQQTELGGESDADAKEELKRRLKTLEDELNVLLAGQYGIKNPKSKEFAAWQESHEPFHWFAEFYGIMSEGGFDVIIGNPPYVEYRTVKEYRLMPGYYKSESAGNLYAFSMERSCSLLNARGMFGMIVPAGVIGLDDTFSLRKIMLDAYKTHYCSTYAIRPSKLFDGVDQRLCIYLADRKTAAKSPQIWTTKYHHWNTEERSALFQNLTYSESFLHSRMNRIPQIGNENAKAVLAKLEAMNNKTVSSYYSVESVGFLMHYHRSPRYWIRAMDFEQYFKSETRTRSIHHFRNIYFRDSRIGKFIGSILNSTLFFFWFISVGNGRNITGRDVELLPVGDIDSPINDLSSLFDTLMQDYKNNSFVRVREDCEYQEFRPSHSKPIIDEIDRALARHYGLTAEELDFVINYDVKYRLGASAVGEDGDE